MRSRNATTGLGLALACAALSPALAQAAPVAPSRAELVREIETGRLDVPRPTLLAAPAAGRALLIGNRAGARRVSLTERGLGRADARALARRTTRGFGARLRLDGRGRRILRVTPTGPETFATLRGNAGKRYQALAYNPADRLVYALGRRAVVGFDAQGRRLHVASLGGLQLVDPRAIAFARTGDPTDAAGAYGLYVADRGDALRAGRVVEARFASARAVRSVISEVPAPFVRSIKTSAFDPSAPDPAGLAYVAASDSFIVADSEVDEMTIWKGFNLFTTLRGSAQGTGTGTTTAFSKEPSGLGYDAATATLYVSDDDGDRITVDQPGADGRHGTKDDVFRRFSTSAFGSFDAEGVEYDPTTGHVFICDGTGLEVYDVEPRNGVFGDGDDVVTSFDIARYGMRDCEGLGLDVSRGLLLAVDPTRRDLFELTRAGELTRIVDLNAIPATSRNLASVTVAPTSNPADDPAARSFWVADRQRDNGTDPNENDGLLHELGIPGVPPPADAPPTVSVTAPAAGTAVSGVTTVRASAADDRNAVASVRVLVDGAQVGIDTSATDGWSVAWDTGAVVNGGHTVTAVATDAAGNTGASAPVQVVVQNAAPSAPPQTLTVAVVDRSDDASELQNGTVNRTTGDLELGSDLGVPTTTGVRFRGLAIPRGAVITRASVQFNADELDRQAASLTIRAQQADSAAAFTSTAFDVSSRPRTAASATWSVPTWTVFGATGAEQRTPDLSALLQEVVNRPGWTSGSSLALLVTGTGRRTAESFDGGFPPVLTVEFAGP